MHVRQEKKEDMWKIVYEMVKPGRHYHHSSNSSYYPLTKASFCCISDWLVCNYNTRGRGIFADTWQCVSSAVCPNNHIKLQLSDWMRAGLDLCPPTNTWTGQTIISAIKIESNFIEIISYVSPGPLEVPEDVWTPHSHELRHPITRPPLKASAAADEYLHINRWI